MGNAYRRTLICKVPIFAVKLGEKPFALKDKDSVAYVFDVINYEQLGLDSAAVKYNTSPEMFADNLKQTFEQGLGIEFEHPTESKWYGFPSYKTNNLVHGKEDIYTYTILIGLISYNLIVYVPQGGSITGKEIFFSSVILSK